MTRYLQKLGTREMTIELAEPAAFKLTVQISIRFSLGLGEYVAVYETGGVPALQGWVRRVNEARKQRTFFVRVATRDRVDLLLVVPEDWLPEEVSRTDTRGSARPRAWLRIPRDEEVDLTVASTILPVLDNDHIPTTASPRPPARTATGQRRPTFRMSMYRGSLFS